jgi:two-component system, cell cycle sensor histidine kinase and response regulator CckA
MASYSTRPIPIDIAHATPHAGPVMRSRSWKVLVDAEGTVRSIEGPWPAENASAAARAIAVGTSYYSFLAGICGQNPERAAALAAAIRTVAAGREDTFSLEFPCRLADCEMRIRLVVSPYRQGCVEGVLLVHTDAGATPSKGDPQTDVQVHKMEALGRLTSGVAHDFANLLTLITGYSEMLLSRMHASDPMRPELEEIREAARRGAGMTARILDFIGRQVTEPQLVDLNSLVEKLEKLLRPIIGDHIRLVTALSPDLHNIRADPAQMTRIIMNLVLNARDAMPRGGEINIRTANLELDQDGTHTLPPGHYVTLGVEDTGHGMDPETLSHLFQPFFTTKEPGRGTGLGLSTVYGIVKQSDGDVWVRSEPGKGTVVTVCLPRAGESGETAEPSDRTLAAGAGTETILVAEDEESVRRFIKHLLAGRGYHVLEAVNGSDALRFFGERSVAIDLLLTDLVMPGMNGRELAQKALACRPDLKVIYMSGYSDDMLLTTAALGPDMSFLRKPLTPDVLATRIREVLDTLPHK